MGPSPEFLEYLAQNDYMVDNHFLPDGITLRDCVQLWRKERAWIMKVSKHFDLSEVHGDD